MSSNVPLAVRLAIKNALDRLSFYFKRETKLTLIVRTPGNPDADIVVTADDFSELSALIERNRSREEVPLVG